MSDIRELIKSMERTLHAIKCCSNSGSTNTIDFTPVINKLEELNQNIQDIEVTAGNISLNADQINLNTDQVESLLEDIKLLLSPPKFLIRGLEVNSVAGKTLKQLIDGVYGVGTVNYNKIYSVSISNRTTASSMDVSTNGGLVTLQFNDSVSWGAGNNALLDVSNFTGVTFLAGNVAKIIFEEQL